MSTCFKLVCALALNCLVAVHARAMAGDLNQPSIAMPAETPSALREQLLAALKDPECKFLDGHFINATTTLNYGGSTPSLNRLITRLAECDCIEVVVTFVKGDAGGPSWTVNHSGWGAPNTFGIQINLAASALNLDQLAITVARMAKKSDAAKPR
jgi:hypothetical protein